MSNYTDREQLVIAVECATRDYEERPTAEFFAALENAKRDLNVFDFDNN